MKQKIISSGLKNHLFIFGPLIIFPNTVIEDNDRLNKGHAVPVFFFFTLSHCKSRAVVILCGTRPQTILAGKKYFPVPLSLKGYPATI